MKKYGKVDLNQKQIVEGLKKLGISVKSAASLGDGFPDLVIGFRGKNYLFEIKDGSKPPSQRKLTPDEILFHEYWQGQLDVVTTLDEVLKVIGLK